jgi:PAB1-binding protein PBP1
VLAASETRGNDLILKFKMVRETLSSGQANGAGTGSSIGDYAGSGDDHEMLFPFSALSSVSAAQKNILKAKGGASGKLTRPTLLRPSLITLSAAAQGFRTDTDISGNLVQKERNLQRWEAPTGFAGATDMSLESGEEWDQFKANEERFGLRSDYDENIYTTAIDRSNPLYKMREREAERIAREIEGSSAATARRKQDDGLDEEDKYA